MSFVGENELRTGGGISSKQAKPSLFRTLTGRTLESSRQSTFERSSAQLQGQIPLKASGLACASEHAFARRRVKWLRCRALHAV
jgi:hypothetical protein